MYKCKLSLQLESCRRIFRLRASLCAFLAPQGAPENPTSQRYKFQRKQIESMESQRYKSKLERPRQWCSRDTLLRGRCRRRLLRSYATLDHADEGKALVVVGSANADMVLQVNRLPVAGETLAAESLETFPGGKVRAALPFNCNFFFLNSTCKTLKLRIIPAEISN